MADRFKNGLAFSLIDKSNIKFAHLYDKLIYQENDEFPVSKLKVKNNFKSLKKYKIQMCF